MGFKEESEKLLSGELSIRERHPLIPTGESEEVAAGVMFWRWFANMTAVKTEDGLVLVDTGAHHNQAETVSMVRRWSPDRVNTAIYTHGHVDHAAGMTAFAAEAQQNRRCAPARGRPSRDRRAFRSLPAHRGLQQHHQLAAVWRADPMAPRNSFIPILTSTIDLTWSRVPGVSSAITRAARPTTIAGSSSQAQGAMTGDFMIWAAPNAGNPQKSQRYAREWAEALRAMAKTGAEVMLPGHGIPVFGSIRVRQVLNDTAEYLQSLYDQTLKMMNDGAPLDDIMHGVKPPAALAEKPYLQPIYDEPEFIVRNVWRLEGGWYDGIASHLKPAPHSAQATEIAAISGGADVLLERALEKMSDGDFALAAHLIDWAVAAAPDDRAAHEARMRIYAACAPIRARPWRTEFSAPRR